MKKEVKFLIGGSILFTIGLVFYALNSPYASILLAIGFTLEAVAVVIIAYKKMNQN